MNIQYSDYTTYVQSFLEAVVTFTVTKMAVLFQRPKKKKGQFLRNAMAKLHNRSNKKK